MAKRTHMGNESSHESAAPPDELLPYTASRQDLEVLVRHWASVLGIAYLDFYRDKYAAEWAADTSADACRRLARLADQLGGEAVQRVVTVEWLKLLARHEINALEEVETDIHSLSERVALWRSSPPRLDKPSDAVPAVAKPPAGGGEPGETELIF